MFVALAVLAGVALAAGAVLAFDGLPGGDEQPVHAAAVRSPAPPPVPSSTPPTTTTTPPPPPPPPPTTTTPPPPPSTTTPPPPRPGTTSKRATTTTKAGTSAAGQVLALVNQERAAAGCAALTADSRLATAARKHSDDMSARGYFSHTTPEGTSFADRITAAGYPSPGAENIAKGSTTAEQTMRMWMNSDGHRRNILNCSYHKLGVGVATSGWYWTQDFGF
ncbi:hypothetical protein GCM10027445_04070 [Amycolatopsis endophytica]